MNWLMTLEYQAKRLDGDIDNLISRVDRLVERSLPLSPSRRVH